MDDAGRQPRSRTRALLRLSLAVVPSLVLGGLAGWGVASARSSSPSNNVSTVAPTTATTVATTADAAREAIVTKVKPSVVQINVTLANGGAIGSGVVIDSKGDIITNNHVVTGQQSIQVVLSSGTKEAATVAGTDAANDLAVVRIAVPSGGLPVATLGNSAQLQVGQAVLAIGNPLGDTQTVTNGIVSALKRTVSEGSGGPTIQNAIQTDAAINPGNSGGALVDMQGNVVGIPTLTAIDPEFNAPANGVGFAIPANRVATVIAQLVPNG
jgi:S1-C subfamily serine protease